jgi:hypothetical protein
MSDCALLDPPGHGQVNTVGAHFAALAIDEELRAACMRAVAALDGDAAASVLRRLSDEYELVAYGLGQVRREWERHQRPN